MLAECTGGGMLTAAGGNDTVRFGGPHPGPGGDDGSNPADVAHTGGGTLAAAGSNDAPRKKTKKRVKQPGGGARQRAARWAAAQIDNAGAGV